jgi:serine/threonine-protein kinase
MSVNTNLYSWGNNANGQIGDGTTNNRLTPFLLSNLAHADVAAGGNSSAFIRG